MADLPPGCAKPVMAMSNWFLASATIAMSLTESGQITPEVTSGMQDLATKFDGYAADIESAFPDAPASYAALAETFRAEAEVLHTWPERNTTTDRLSKAMDAVTNSPDGQEALSATVQDLETRCPPWRFN